MKKLQLFILPQELAICRFPPDTPLPEALSQSPFWSVTRTKSELSIVLPEVMVSKDWKAEKGWRAIGIEGVLAFGLTGILSSLAAPLAASNISIFAISTFDTDYILVRSEALERAKTELLKQGYEFGS